MNGDYPRLIDLAERAVRAAVAIGAEQCDAVALRSVYTSVEMERSSVKQANIADDPGLAVRAYLGGSCGFAYCGGHDSEAVKKTVEMAVSLARAGSPDAEFKGLPTPGRTASVGGLYDERIANLKSEEVVEMVLTMSEVAGADEKITSINASIGAGTCKVALANSNGLSSEQNLTSFDAVVEAVARHGDVMFSGYDGLSGRRMEAVALDDVAVSAREHAIRGLSQTKIETGEYVVIVDPLAAGFILAEAIGGGANGENVQRGRSYLAGRLGTEVAGENITISDDPTIEWTVGSTSFDGEGTPASVNTLIDRGKLVSYLHDSYTAAKAGIESTGNSSRGGAIWSYRRPPSISPSNLVVEPGDSSLEEMVSETKRGVYLRATFDYPNLATGEFSGLMMESYLVKDGEIGPSIRQSTVGIDMLDLLSRVDLIGKKSKDYFGVRTPVLRISRARVAGSA